MCALRLTDIRRPTAVSKDTRALSGPAGSQPISSDVIIGDDWTPSGDAAPRSGRRGGITSLKRSPLARKIITFNLLALIVLVAGMLYLTPTRVNLAYQRASSLCAEAELMADAIEARLVAGDTGAIGSGAAGLLDSLTLRGGITVALYDPAGQQLASRLVTGTPSVPGMDNLDNDGSFITGTLTRIWDSVTGIFGLSGTDPGTAGSPASTGPDLVTRALTEGTLIVETGTAGSGEFLVLSPILSQGQAVAAVAVQSTREELDILVNRERERVLRMFIIGALVSVALSLMLASTIANPLADLAAAAERGRDRDSRKHGSGRLPIPDLTARPDEIGRLSGALRNMVSALYDRIDTNKQFAADVAHEIKNPLASLRSAVGTLRMTKRDDQRRRLLDIIDHDVRRLDRLVTDIASASRLDSELVKEEEKPFDLLHMIANINEFLGKEAAEKGIEFISDLPPGPLVIRGLEMRLAQVMVNLITNAISFCDEGDAIRIWVRQRERRVLIVVEDTGPGIPEAALTRIFDRFYSERPPEHFGNNSGLGLSISKQIIEAHSGVIWAENIRPTDADPTSLPLGARFVVGLPL